MAIKTQTLSASRAGLGSVVATDSGTSKTQVISNVGAVGVVGSAPVVGATVFIIHPAI